MAEVTNELMYELMKRMHQQMGEMKQGIREVKSELVSIRGHMLSMQHDIHNMYGVLGRHDERFERIERRLELREMAEPQRPFDHNS
ncbi:hypothetical protein [Aurantimonas marina]|uniref:hypothetical protein n=1 Tax=Aurantimonas marina TaxID=2780508 RepID=UPI0019D2A151|nr:hypothetical protein [Aurantimonas marina]